MKKRLSVLFAVVVALTALMLFSATASAEEQVVAIGEQWSQSWPASEYRQTYRIKVAETGFYDWHITDNNRTGWAKINISDINGSGGYAHEYDFSNSEKDTVIEKNILLRKDHTYTVYVSYGTTRFGNVYLDANISIVYQKASSQPQVLTETSKAVTVENYSTTVFSFTTDKAGDYVLKSNKSTCSERLQMEVKKVEDFSYYCYGYLPAESSRGLLFDLEANQEYYLLLKMNDKAANVDLEFSIEKTPKDLVDIVGIDYGGAVAPWESLDDLEPQYTMLFSDGSNEKMTEAEIEAFGFLAPRVEYIGDCYYDNNHDRMMIAGRQPVRIGYTTNRERTLYITVSRLVDEFAAFPALKTEEAIALSNNETVNAAGCRIIPKKTAIYDFYVYGNGIDDFWPNAELVIYDQNNHEVHARDTGYPLLAGKTYLMLIQYEGWNSSLGERVLYYAEEGSLKPPMRTGWEQSGGFWVYYNEFGHQVKNQWVEDSKGWCYLDQDGHMSTNQWLEDTKGWCHVGANGYMVTNQWVQDSNGWCYLNDKGYITTNKWVKDSKGWCYLGADGYMVTDKWMEDSNGLIYIGSNGYMVTNTWVTYKGDLYYMDSDGYIAKNCWAKRDGKWSYLDANGYIATGCWKKDSKGWCYLDEEGYMVTNNWVPDSKDLVYVGADGYMVVNKWIEDSNGWRYVGSDGYPTRKTWKKDSKGWCYLGVDGYMTVNDWVPDSKGYVFVGSNGYMVTNSWVADVEGLRYVGADGYITRNKWVKLQGKWCYLDTDGYPATDCWKKDSKGWCYLDSEGFMVTNQWVPDSVGLVYVGSDGYMVVNKWIEDETGWRYAGPQGYYLKNCWQKDSKGWCYLQDDGYMVVEGWVKDSVGWCYLDASGYWDGKYFDAPPIEAA